MVGKPEKIHTQEIGLEIGHLIGRFFLKTPDLHYGYWTEDMEVDVANFARAQANHSKFIIDHIPEGTRTVLDVGAGSGHLAHKLITRGYTLDCVSPSAYLSDQLRQRLGPEPRIYECKYQDLETDRRYDLILFSESFLYVPLQAALQKSFDLLSTGGHLLICDFFQLEERGKSLLRGGHKFGRFQALISEHPFEKVEDIDITKNTAPTLQLFDDFIAQVVAPGRDVLARYLDSNHPRLMQFLRWKFKKRIAKLERVYFSRRINAESYQRHKTYRLLLFRKP